mgnify:CR=1 FL=1
MMVAPQYRVFVLCICLNLLWSCKLGEPYARPEVQAPETYRAEPLAGESVANLPWWELFQDTVLQDLIRVGIAHNRDLNAAVARIRQAEAQIGIVRANLNPRINYGAGGTFTADSDESSDSKLAGNALLNASWILDIWGRYRNLTEAAFQEYLATEEAYRGLTLLVVGSIAQSYLLLRDLDNRLSVSEQTLETWQYNLDLVQARFNAGIVSEVDVKQSIIQVEEAKTSIQTFTRLRRQTENAISVLIGLPPQSIERGVALQDQIFPPSLPAGLPSQLLDRRPDVLAAERRLEAQTARIGATEALLYPELTIG